jgi:hypothetical protein
LILLKFVNGGLTGELTEREVQASLVNRRTQNFLDRVSMCNKATQVSG